MNINDKIICAIHKAFRKPAKARFEQYMEKVHQIFQPWRLGVEGNVVVDEVRQVYEFTLVAHLTEDKRGETSVEISFDEANAFIALDPTDGRRILNDATIQKIYNGIVTNLTNLNRSE